ncbi:MAG TPA: hypothetical protein VLI04_19180, partial [Nocardioidaceae bacterium]|nr:hypothetical protein [Nocardioidaceae bacterium]
PAGFGFTLPVRFVRGLNGMMPGMLRVPPLPMWLLRRVLVSLYAFAAGPGLRLEPSVGRAWVGQFRNREDLRHTLDLVQRVVVEIDDVGELPAPAYPLLLVWGSRDLLVSQNRHFAVENVVLKRRGHCPQLQDAQGLADLVLEFSARLPGSAASASA